MDYISPIGVLRIEASEKGLRSIRYLSNEQASSEPALEIPQSENARNSMALCISALNSYFAKQWGAFEQIRSKIPLDLKGSAFQRKVWGAIYSLPNIYPICISYSELATLVGKPSAVRACANICGQNDIPILIPCHRVITVNGQLGGYSSGVFRKSWLLWHEGLLAKGSKSNILLLQPPQTR
ncbi:MAG: methylated-DNA--[protein]-cysteine S-methyltransferase [Fibromonadales bacterium]|nr:methylated-DNA--[protein]-cysteine S-methyltransferase [Fibromonadales bacterium]